MHLEHCSPDSLEELVNLRALLWPDEIPSLKPGAIAMLAHPDMLALLARDEVGTAIAFVEASIRRDYVNGCETSPVGFLEGIFVRPGYRRRGVARALCAAVAAWTKEKGCSELASDALLDNESSHAMHKALGFSETERVVYFLKKL